VPTDYNFRMKKTWQYLHQQLDGIYIERAYHYTCRAPLFSRLHHHEDKFHLIYVLLGKSRIEVDGVRYEVGPHDLIFIRPHQKHVSLGDARTSYELIEIHFMVTSPRAERAVPRLNPVVHVHNPAMFVPSLERLVAAHLIDGSKHNWLAKGRLTEVLMLAARETSWHAVTDQPLADIDRKIRQATEYIAVNYPRDFGLEDLADLVGLSVSHFSSCFKTVTGKSPIEFLIDRRLHHARELLQNSTFSIRQIAQMSGFASSQYFARLFATRNGISPTQFRNKK
jgi:AraC-like DNA-binding protein/mannose-6-phosphate isomerase-like protein (cupin superfamily)